MKSHHVTEIPIIETTMRLGSQTSGIHRFPPCPTSVCLLNLKPAFFIHLLNLSAAPVAIMNSSRLLVPVCSLAAIVYRSTLYSLVLQTGSLIRELPQFLRRGSGSFKILIIKSVIDPTFSFNGGFITEAWASSSGQFLFWSRFLAFLSLLGPLGHETLLHNPNR